MSNPQRYNVLSRDLQLKAAIETAVHHAIFNDPSFTIDVPKLSLGLWEQVNIVTPPNKEENERLEFLGDRLMGASIAINLYKIIPDGTPHKYTVMINVLQANRTFCYLAQRMEIEYSGQYSKSVGDAVEVIVGAYYTEKGFEAVHEWASGVYEMLIREASAAFDNCLRDINALSAAASDLPRLPKKGKRKAALSQRPSSVQPIPSSPTSALQPSGPYPSTRGRRERSYSTSTLAEPSAPRMRTSPSRGDDSDRTQWHFPRPPVPSLQNDIRHSERMPPKDPSQPLSGDGEEQIPEFCEKGVSRDGRTYIINHLTQTTTWERPSHAHGPHPSDSAGGEGPDLLWRPLFAAVDSDQSHDDFTDPVPARLGGGTEPFPELLEDGYERDGEASPRLTALPDFWEELQGQDGLIYYIDHAKLKFMRKSY